MNGSTNLWVLCIDLHVTTFTFTRWLVDGEFFLIGRQCHTEVYDQLPILHSEEQKQILAKCATLLNITQATGYQVTGCFVSMVPS